MNSTDFLNFIFGPLEKDTAIEIRLLDKKNPSEGLKPSQIFLEGEYTETLQKIESTALNSSLDVYYGVARRKKVKNSFTGKKQGFDQSLVLWADLDEVTDYEEQLKKFLLPPTIILNSGNGFHCYWKLHTALDSVFDIETLLKGLTTILGADIAATDATRILRIPQTLNHKTNPPKQVAVVEFNPTYIYDLQEITNVINQHKFLPVDEVYTVPKKGNRSEFDFHIAKKFAAFNLSRETVEFIFKVKPFGKKYRQEGEHYLKTTLDKIYSKNDGKIESIKQKILPLNQILIDYPNYQIFKLNAKLNISRNIANFVLHLKTIHVNKRQEKMYVCDFVGKDAQRNNICLEASDFSDNKTFMNQANLLGFSWAGSIIDLQAILAEIQNVWVELGKPTSKVVDKLGVQYIEKIDGTYEKIFVFSDVVLDPLLNKSHDVVYQPKKINKTPPYLSTKNTSMSVDLSTVENLHKLNKPEIIYPVLGWYTATQLKPYLYMSGKSFPHLFIYGSRGTGKTTLVQHMQSMFYKGNFSVTASSTPFVLMSALGSSYSLPINLSEFRENTFNHGRLNSFYETLRNLYDGLDERRGTQKQEIKEYSLCTPVVIDGEHSINDAAVRERVIALRLSPLRSAEKPYIEANKALTPVNLGRLGSQIQRFSFIQSENNFLEEGFSQGEKLFERITNYRTTHNISVVLSGLYLLDTFFKTTLGDSPLNLKDENIFSIFNSMLEEENLSNNEYQTDQEIDEFLTSAVNHIITCILTNEDTDIPYHYSFESPQEISFNFKSAYEHFAERKSHHAKTNYKTMRSQLKDRVGQYIDKLSIVKYSQNGSTSRMIVFNIQSAIDSGLDIQEIKPL